MFQLIEPIRPTKAIKQMRDRPILNGASKKANELELVSIIKLTMRMAVVHKATVSAVHEVTLSLVYKITLLTVRIELTKAVTSLLVNTKSTWSRGTSKNATIYLAAW